MNIITTKPIDYGEQPIDIFQQLAEERMLFISGEITDQLACDIVATLLILDKKDQNEKISLFITSEGGDIRNVLMIYDMIKHVKCPIETICLGAALNEAAVLLAAGTPGMRLATKNSVISFSQLVHQYTNYSDLTDAKTSLENSIIDNKKVMEIIASATKKTVKDTIKLFDRTVFFTASQAIKHKFIDRIIKGVK